MSTAFRFRREKWALDRVLFSAQPPEAPYRHRVFAARDHEFEAAEVAIYDAPKNILVGGLFGIGKTIFVLELIDHLRQAYPDTMLVAYECLDDQTADLPTVILRGLARAVYDADEDEEAGKLLPVFANMEVAEQTGKGYGLQSVVGATVFLPCRLR